MALPNQVPVAVVGGGPIGLVSSILLSIQSIPHVLFERHPGTSIHPKAMGIHPRTVEIFSKVDLLDVLYRNSAPVNRSTRTAWYTSLGPRGCEICSRDAWGGGKVKDAYERASPARYCDCAQIRLEPILLRRARELNPDGIFHNHDVVSVEDSAEDVKVNILNRETSQKHLIRAKYVLGADGGRHLAESLGIKWKGETNIVDMVTAHIRAPIARYHPDTRNFITWFINPEMGGSIKTGLLYHLGPFNSTYDGQAKDGGISPDEEEWSFLCAINPNEPKKFTVDDMVRRIHTVLKIEELDEKSNLEVISMSHWFVNAVTVERYRSILENGPGGRVFLLGDAAHRTPPWGALGMNTGIQDADNLIWKLAWALKDEQSGKNWDALLDTYDQERRPVGESVVVEALTNLKTHGGVLDKAIGIDPSKGPEENVEAMRQYFDHSSAPGKEKRAAVDRAMEFFDIEFSAHGAEMGMFYPSADLEHEGDKTSHDGQLRENGDFDIVHYHPSTIPGHHLPHAWLRQARRGFQRTSTRDLIKTDAFLLLANQTSWTGLGHPQIDVQVIGKGSWEDADGSWRELCGVGETGAVLVRPDGIVAYRFQDDSLVSSGNPDDRIEQLLAKVLRTDTVSAVNGVA